MKLKKDAEEWAEKFRAAVDSLPTGLQSAVWWALGHWEFVEAICKNCGMSEAELIRDQREALRKKDDLAFVLLCFARAFQQEDAERQGQGSQTAEKEENESGG